MNIPESILWEIMSYLDPIELKTILSLNSIYYSGLNSSNFQSFWLMTRMGLENSLNLSALRQAYDAFSRNEIIHYEPWLTTGGQSQRELRNSYNNM